MTTTKRYGNEHRAAIVHDYMATHGVDRINPEAFLEDARHPEHEAHDYFDWDDGHAAHQWRLAQARTFLRIAVTTAAVPVHQISDGTVPLLVAPVETRRMGGGYVSVATDEGVAELRRQTLQFLVSARRSGATIMSDIQRELLDDLIDTFEPVKPCLD